MHSQFMTFSRWRSAMSLLGKEGRNHCSRSQHCTVADGVCRFSTTHRTALSGQANQANVWGPVKKNGEEGLRWLFGVFPSDNHKQL